jgi:hypothetical protein
LNPNFWDRLGSSTKAFVHIKHTSQAWHTTVNNVYNIQLSPPKLGLVYWGQR